LAGWKMEGLDVSALLISHKIQATSIFCYISGHISNTRIPFMVDRWSTIWVDVAWYFSCRQRELVLFVPSLQQRYLRGTIC